MKPTQLYLHLKELADKLDIAVAEQNLRVTGVNAKSGLCIVKDQKIFIMDKHLNVREKVETLADCLRTLPLDDIYVMPAVRKYLDRSDRP
ncbi:MAG: hypothetical protein HF978_09870 [Desulfobacteraceae bacterium]|nr:hypothetical protein [Desulfobacteraceae bacterium]MBC2755842.1 hypothetical protein [Desulfobacteraceae bacterium]